MRFLEQNCSLFSFLIEWWWITLNAENWLNNWFILFSGTKMYINYSFDSFFQICSHDWELVRVQFFRSGWLFKIARKSDSLFSKLCLVWRLSKLITTVDEVFWICLDVLGNNWAIINVGRKLSEKSMSFFWETFCRHVWKSGFYLALRQCDRRNWSAPGRHSVGIELKRWLFFVILAVKLLFSHARSFPQQNKKLVLLFINNS